MKKRGEEERIRGESQAPRSSGSARCHGNSSEARRAADRRTRSLERTLPCSVALSLTPPTSLLTVGCKRSCLSAYPTQNTWIQIYTGSGNEGKCSRLDCFQLSICVQVKFQNPTQSYYQKCRGNKLWENVFDLPARTHFMLEKCI